MLSTAPIACNLTAIPEAERPRYFALRAEVLATVSRARDTTSGLALTLAAPLPALAEWIAYERVCCPFLSFRLAIDGDGPVELEMLGAEGVKGFLRAELTELVALTSPERLAATSLLRPRR